MEVMKVICPVNVKVRVTPNFKSALTSEIQDALKKLELEIQQLDFQLKRQKSSQTKEALEKEKQKRLDTKLNLMEKLKKIPEIEDGEEIIQGTINGIIEVKPGDSWSSLLGREIVLQDGLVKELR
ncbi:MAG: hypothetical protein HPY70_03675 [Firmicutes bacterium]|nr:hypothetical protein [Bacillota bacterium]